MFGPRTKNLQDLDASEKARITTLSDTLAMMRDCYNKALAAHALEQSGNGLRVKAAPGAAPAAGAQTPDQALEDAVTRMQQHVTGSEEAYLDKSKQLLRQEYTRRLAERRQGNDDLNRVLKAQYPGIRATLFSEAAYGDVQGIRDLIDNPANAENVAQHREIVTKMLSDFTQLMEIYGEYSLRLQPWTNMEADLSKKNEGKEFSEYSPEDQLQSRLITAEYEPMMQKQAVYLNAVNDLKAAMMRVVKGRGEIDGKVEQLLCRYGYAPAVNERTDIRQAATLYSDTYKAKLESLKATARRRFPGDDASVHKYTTGTEGRIIMMMRPGDDAYNDEVLDMQMKKNEVQRLRGLKKQGGLPDDQQETLTRLEQELAGAAEQLLVPCLKTMMDFNVPKTRDLTNEQLIALQPELTEVAMASMMMSDLSAQIASDIPGLSILEKMLGKPAPDSEAADPDLYRAKLEMFNARKHVFMCKKPILENLRLQSRMAAILEAATRTDSTDPLSMMTSAELEAGHHETNREIQKLSPAEVAQLTDAEKVILYARAEMDKGRRVQRDSEERLLKGEALRVELINRDDRARDYPELRYGKVQEVHGGSALCEEAAKKIGILREMHREQEGSQPDDYSLAKEWYQTAKHAGDFETMLQMSVYFKLHRDHYRMAGADKPVMPAPMFRSFAASDSMSSVAAMSEQDYRNMLSDLSAGAFMDGNTMPEEAEEALQRNRKGLRTYFAAIAPHYEELERKYGHEVPDLSYIILHQDELTRELASVQEDCNLITRAEGVLDPENASDARLIRLVEHFNSFAYVTQSFLRAAILGTPEDSLTHDDLYQSLAQADEFRRMQASAQYLREHPKGEE